MPELADLGDWHFWDGEPPDPALEAFLARPGVIWWLAWDLFSDGGARLGITYDCSTDHPLVVPPRSWLKWEPAAAAFSWFERGPLDE